MFKNLKDLIKTKEKLEVAEVKLALLNRAIKSNSELLENQNDTIKHNKEHLNKLSSIIATKKETLKGLNGKINPGLSTPKKAAPKKAVKKTK
jgi:chromosome segregation ATPase